MSMGDNVQKILGVIGQVGTTLAKLVFCAVHQVLYFVSFPTT